MAARDPLAVIDGYMVEIRLRLPLALGVRMCPLCPRCNETMKPCQDKFGSNMMPLGGILGGCPALGAGTEHQGVGTPHIHGNAHVACIYQYSTLQEIADRIVEKALDPVLVQNYQAWMHKEDPLVPSQHDAFAERVEEEFQHRFAGREHDAMCSTPDYMAEDKTLTMWATGGPTLQQALEEGGVFKKAYLEDAQFIFSRVQHHVHKKTKKGYVPLKACLSKRCKKGTCKADFPKDKMLTDRMVVVCRGVARKFKLRISGRRNSLGAILGRRTGGWQSGTHPAFAVIFRSNTHTQPNHRLPLLEATHEDVLCQSDKCKATDKKTVKVICKLTQRACREATGYFCGYTFKAQPVGKRELKAAGECLNYMNAGLADKSVGAKWHRMTHRVLQDLQHRCMLRTAPEEVNLAINANEHDVKNAEFLRTFMSADFPGGQLVQRLEQEKKGKENAP